jgi:hypothetical protein
MRLSDAKLAGAIDATANAKPRHQFPGIWDSRGLGREASYFASWMSIRYVRGLSVDQLLTRR